MDALIFDTIVSLVETLSSRLSSQYSFYELVREVFYGEDCGSSINYPSNPHEAAVAITRYCWDHNLLPHGQYALERLLRIVRTDLGTERHVEIDGLIEMVREEGHTSVAGNQGYGTRGANDDYNIYLAHVIHDLADWEQKYTPLFARFDRIPLLAKLRSKNDDQLNPEPLITIITRSRVLVILGVAGSGKTSTLRRVVLDMARATLSATNQSPIPVLVELRDFGSAPVVTVEYLVSNTFRSFISREGVVENTLVEGNFLLVFDGLNEVTEDKRNDCCGQLRQFIRSYPRCRYLFTSRPTGFDASCLSASSNILQGTPDLPTCEILPLSREQIGDYIRRYIEDRNDADALVGQLRLHNPSVWSNPGSLARLASTPMLLQMLIITYKEHQRIPLNEGELLLNFIDFMLSKQEPGKAAGIYPIEVKKKILPAIAWEMYKSGREASLPTRLAFATLRERLATLKSDGRIYTTVSDDGLWAELQNNNLIVVDGDSTYWPHPLYRDLFIGLELHTLCYDNSWEARDAEIQVNFRVLLAKVRGDPAFEAGVMMLCTIPSAYRINALVAVGKVNPSISWESFLRMEPSFQPGLDQRFLRQLETVALASNATGDQHRNLVRVVRKITDSEMCNTLDKIARYCPTWEGRYEAIVAINFDCNTCTIENNFGLFLHIMKNDPEPNNRIYAFVKISEIIAGDVTPERESLYDQLVAVCLEDNDFVADHIISYVRTWPNAIKQKFITTAVAEVQTIKVRHRAIWLLGQLQSSFSDAVLSLQLIALKDTECSVRHEAVHALRFSSDKSTIRALTKVIRNDDSSLVRERAVRSLSAMNIGITNGLMIALGDGDESVGNAAIEAISVNSLLSSTFKALANAARTSSEPTRSRALQALIRVARTSSDTDTRYKAGKELVSHRAGKASYLLADIASGIYAYDVQMAIDLFHQLLAGGDSQIVALVHQRCEELGISE